MNRFRTATVLLVSLVACAQDKQTVDSTTTQTPSQPRGSVVGVVTSLRTGAPLQGVVVSVPQASGLVTDTTDANGAYGLSGLVAGGTYELRYALAGHVPSFASGRIPDSAGDFPTDGVLQLDVALAQANATVSGHVTARNGVAAAGVVLTADLRNQGFDLVAQATTDAQGAYSLSGLPGAPTGLTVTLVAQPWDANADGLADYEALARAVPTYPGATSLLDVDLRAAAADLLLLTSNLESGILPASASILLTFNRQLDAVLTDATLYDSTAAKTVAVVVSVDGTGKILTIVPAGATGLAPYHSYSLTVYAEATNGSRLIVNKSFTADVPASLLPAITGLTVTPASADYDTATYTLSWNASASAAGYQVWARDTNRNPDYLLLKTLGSTPAPSTSVTLPATFDWYSADALVTPLAFGVAVDLAVVAVNAAGDAPLPSSATPVRRSDTVAPWALTGQSGQADNSAGGSARTITLTATFDEYMDPSVLPTISLPAGLTSTFDWSASRTVGTFRITIPASTDGRGAFTIAGAKDTSGNLMTPKTGQLTSIVQLVVNGGFESGDLTGWAPTFAPTTGTATAPVASSSFFATGAWSARIGNAAGTAQSGVSQLTQTLTLPAGYTSIVASVAYRPYSSYPNPGWDTSSCVIQNAGGTSTLATLFSTYSNQTYFTTATSNITGLGGQTVRLVCQTNQRGSDVTGMYLDDVSILATP
jgi:hypothetical protein